MLNGGLERWCRDLALLLEHDDWRVTVFQKALRPFRRRLGDAIEVVGVPAALTARGNLTLYRALTRAAVRDTPACFVSHELALGRHFERAVGVNHGVWWDGDMPRWKLILNRLLQRRLIENVRAVACVDTNYINWCHAELSERGRWQEKLHYIPNYADEALFAPDPAGGRGGRGELVILFPRRVTDAASLEDLDRQGRGAGLLLRAAECLERGGVKFRLLFAGRGAATSAIREFSRQRGWVDRVETFEAELDQMPEVYRRADVVVVPSTAHEGTSLSAVESLVAGKPTVVSHIGGLPNLVIPGLVGEVSDLRPEALAAAILRATERPPMGDSHLRSRYAECMGKTRWTRDVRAFLRLHLG
jgi:glycosyltransferase involved in cell wall biosynthesis